MVSRWTRAPTKCSVSSGRTARGRLLSCACSPGSATLTQGACFSATPISPASGEKAVARRLAIVEQSPEVHEDITVQETVSLGRTPHRDRFANLDGNDRRAIDRALALTGLLGHRAQRWRSLSGGEQQRTQFARALAQEPEVILLDEPTNHLDIRYQLDVLRLLSTLPLTVVTALHDLNLAARYCDQVVILRGGAIHASERPSEVLTAELLRDVYEVEAVIETSPHTGAAVATFLGRAKRTAAE